MSDTIHSWHLTLYQALLTFDIIIRCFWHEVNQKQLTPTWQFTSVSSPSCRTETEETIPLVLAGSTILTLVRAAMVSWWRYVLYWCIYACVRAVATVSVFSVDTCTLWVTWVGCTSLYDRMESFCMHIYKFYGMDEFVCYIQEYMTKQCENNMHIPQLSKYSF